MLGQGRTADSTFYLLHSLVCGSPRSLVWLQGQWGEATRSQQWVGEGEAPSELGASSCLDQLKPGQTLDGAQEFAIFPSRILAWVSVGFGHPGALLNGKAMAVIPQPLHW